MSDTAKKLPTMALAAVLMLSVAGCGRTNQAVCDDVRVLEEQLDTVSGELEPQVEQEVRDDYAEIATDANCPGYDAED